MRNRTGMSSRDAWRERICVRNRGPGLQRPGRCSSRAVFLMTARDPAPTPVSAARDWLALSLLRALTPGDVHTLVERFGSASGVLDAPAEALAAAGVADAAVAELRAARAAAAREAAAIAAAGARLIGRDDPIYPERLRHVADPPPALTVRGTLDAPGELAVAIVGARRASDYGRRMATRLATGLAHAGITVVSGLAAGIDAAAHRGALSAGGRTIAVLGTGIDRVYPTWHAELAAEVAAQGALVSEFPCGTPPIDWHFPRRNRIISGLTAGTIVVEAAERSGSLITAKYALEQGREVFAVPGPAGVASHRGPHRLIQQGAKLVTDVEDVLQELAPALIGRVATKRAAAAAVDLTAAERAVLDAVGDGRHVDDVIRRAALPAGPALETLLALELRGLVRQLPGRRFRRQAA
jgi:DNA processing protein